MCGGHPININNDTVESAEGRRSLRAFYRRILPLKLRIIIRDFLIHITRSLNQTYGWDRAAVASRYLKGEGIEIGALHTPLSVPRVARVKYVDRMSVLDLRKQYPELDSVKLVNTDIIDDGERLSSIQDSTQNFVIANHFIEHCQNPLMALENMFRVLKENGMLYLAIPDKRFIFDIDRPVTPLDHLLKDYTEGPEWSKAQHYEEFVKLVGKVQNDAEVEKQTSRLIDIDYSIHFHVWTQAEMCELISALNRRLALHFDMELFLKNGTECIFILRKTNS